MRIEFAKEFTVCYTVNSVLILLLFSPGCKEDESMDKNGRLNASECNSSGGDWVYVQDCPSTCDPPAPTEENCDIIEELDCIAVCSELPNCHCPVEKPFWQDGCVGFESCPS